MTLDEALAIAGRIRAQIAERALPAPPTRGEVASTILAAEVLRLREQVAHLERLALRSRSAGAGR